MRTLIIVAVLLGLNAIVMFLLWRGREHEIEAERARRDDPRRMAEIKDILDRAVALLVAEYGAETFAKPQLEQPPAHPTDGTAYPAALAQVLADRWDIALPPIRFAVLGKEEAPFAAATFVADVQSDVLMVSAGEPPAPSPASAWRIALDREHLSDDLAMCTLMAHEFAHGMLGRDGLAADTIAENELRTEVAAVLSGFGLLMLKVQRRITRAYRGKDLTYSIGGPGYLAPSALEYVLDKHRGILSSSAAA